jgi:uncharacterized protein YehS (DUF1456 family)
VETTNAEDNGIALSLLEILKMRIDRREEDGLLVKQRLTREQICDWLKRENDPVYQICSDPELAIFLN